MSESPVSCEACHSLLKAQVDWQKKYGVTARRIRFFRNITTKFLTYAPRAMRAVQNITASLLGWMH